MSDSQQKPKLRVENISCILPETNKLGGLYLGNIYGAQNPDILKEYGIRAVLTSSLETPTYDIEAIPFHLKIKAIDQDSYSIIDDLKQCFQFIDRTRGLTNVLVHCYAGVSRSVTIVVAYIMKKYNWNVEDALNFVKEKRVVAKPNDGFMKQLKQFEQTLPLNPSQKNQSRIAYLLSNDVSQGQQKRQNGSIDQKHGYSLGLPHHYGHNKSIRNQISTESGLTYLNTSSSYRNHNTSSHNFLSGSNTPLNVNQNKNHQMYFTNSQYANEQRNLQSRPEEQGNVTPRLQNSKPPLNKKHSQIPIPSILKRISSNDRKSNNQAQNKPTASNISQLKYYSTSPLNQKNYQRQEQQKTMSRIIRPKDLPGYKQYY